MKLATKFQSYMNQEMIECITHSLCYICVCVCECVCHCQSVSFSPVCICDFVSENHSACLPLCSCVCPIVFMTEPLMLQLGRPNLLHVTSSLPLLSK